MPSNSTGVVTGKDNLVVNFTSAGLKDSINKFLNPEKSDNEIREEFFPNKKEGKHLPGDTAIWKLSKSRQILQSIDWSKDIRRVDYRPFDQRVILYRPDMLEGGRLRIMSNFIGYDNIAICVSKYQKTTCGFSHALIHREIIESGFVSNKTGEIGYSFPLYLYPDKEGLQTERRINFNPDLYAKMRDMAKSSEKGLPDEMQVLDYIYGVLYCLEYRKTYADFLRSGFPKIPWPGTSGEFWHISAMGNILRKLHLMEDEGMVNVGHSFSGGGVDVVEKPCFKNSRIYINKTEFFSDVPAASWDFCVGGSRVAQKWLAARKGKPLAYDDVLKYQRMLKVFAETQEIMKATKINLKC